MTVPSPGRVLTVTLLTSEGDAVPSCYEWYCYNRTSTNSSRMYKPDAPGTQEGMWRNTGKTFKSVPPGPSNDIERSHQPHESWDAPTFGLHHSLESLGAEL